MHFSLLSGTNNCYIQVFSSSKNTEKIELHLKFRKMVPSEANYIKITRWTLGYSSERD